MNTVLFINPTIGFSENFFLVSVQTKKCSSTLYTKLKLDKHDTINPALYFAPKLCLISGKVRCT